MLEQRETYDLIVIGSGPAGHKAAIQGAKIGKRVALIERSRAIGGECVRHGTIPSKTLRATAVQLAAARERLRGVTDEVQLTEQVQIESLMTHLHDVVVAHDAFLSGQLERNGVERIRGKGFFVAANVVGIESVRGERRQIRGDVVLIAAGSHPRNPDNVPVDHEHVLDSDSWLSIRYLPRTLAVLGSGVVACEYASIFASLGVGVTLIDKWPRPLGFLDRELTDRFVANFSAREGCRLLGGVELQSVEWDGVSQVEVRVGHEGGVAETMRFDKVLCALGRVANAEGLGLEAIGVAIDARGQVVVDEHGWTGVDGVYAAGDIVGPPALASTSMAQGRRAVRHAFGLPLEAAADLIPTGIYTIPEISTVGMTPCEVEQRDGAPALFGEARFGELARAHIDGSVDGFLRLVADPEGRRVVGAQIYGEGATELVHIAQLAIVGGLDVDAFIETIFNFPTLSEAYRVAAIAIVRQREELRLCV